jgi:glycosyltransferase involved in cell wall biosynthesis
MKSFKSNDDLKVSIVIPTFNRPQLLDRLLNSITRQTFKDFEVIVIDDASPVVEDYKKVVRKYQTKIKRFRYLRMKDNSGAPQCRNKGILAAKYPLIALVDDDDDWLPRKLEKQLEIFSSDWKNVDLVYTWAYCIAKNGKKILLKPEFEGVTLNDIYKENFIPSPSVLLKKDVLIQLKMFDPSFPSCQDWDLWIRLFQSGYKCRAVHDYLVNYYFGMSNNISTSPRVVSGYYQILKKHLRPAFESNFKNGFILLNRCLTLLLKIKIKQFLKI